jgi:hypothetical protein
MGRNSSVYLVSSVWVHSVLGLGSVYCHLTSGFNVTKTVYY